MSRFPRARSSLPRRDFWPFGTPSGGPGVCCSLPVSAATPHTHAHEGAENLPVPYALTGAARTPMRPALNQPARAVPSACGRSSVVEHHLPSDRRRFDLFRPLELAVGCEDVMRGWKRKRVRRKGRRAGGQVNRTDPPQPNAAPAGPKPREYPARMFEFFALLVYGVREPETAADQDREQDQQDNIGEPPVRCASARCPISVLLVMHGDQSREKLRPQRPRPRVASFCIAMLALFFGPEVVSNGCFKSVVQFNCCDVPLPSATRI